jgi:hypothetical protein
MNRPATVDLESLAFDLPDLAGSEPGLEFRVASTTEELLRELHCRLLGLGHRARAWRVVPETIGWMTLWSRALAVADANRAAYVGASLFAAQITWRAAFELQYHLVVISDPARIRWPDIAGPGNPEHDMSTDDRLCAYLAFCLWNDARYFESQSRGWRLRRIWREEEDAPADTAEAQVLELARRVLPEGLAGEKGDPRELRHRNWRRARIRGDRANHWLGHPRLMRWAETIRATNGGRGPNTFYGVLNPRRDSLAQDTFKTPFALGATEYNRVSALLHGSMLDGFLKLDGTSLALDRAGTDEIEKEVRNNLYTLIMCWLALHELAAHVDPRGQPGHS